MSSKTKGSQDEQEAHEVLRLRASVVYTAVREEGKDELARPMESLWWSGIGAGLAIFLSVVATGALTYYLGADNPAVHLGYTLGFLVVILGRMQLFTENTITAVIPLLSYRNRRTFMATARLWVVVFLANMVGVFIASVATVYSAIFPAHIIEGIMAVSHHYIDRSAWDFFMQGIPAGFIVAVLVWMLPSSRHMEFFVILFMTYIISLTGLTHVIAGSGEAFIMMLVGEISPEDTLFQTILPTLAGNVLGGTAIFSMLAYGQVKEEL